MVDGRSFAAQSAASSALSNKLLNRSRALSIRSSNWAPPCV
jgi:hypothetical protein